MCTTAVIKFITSFISENKAENRSALQLLHLLRNTKYLCLFLGLLSAHLTSCSLIHTVGTSGNTTTAFPEKKKNLSVVPVE